MFIPFISFAQQKNSFPRKSFSFYRADGENLNQMTYYGKISILAFINIKDMESKNAMLKIKQFRNKADFGYSFIVSQTIQEVQSFVSTNSYYSVKDFAIPIPGENYKEKIQYFTEQEQNSLPLFVAIFPTGEVCKIITAQMNQDIINKILNDCKVVPKDEEEEELRAKWIKRSQEEAQLAKEYKRPKILDDIQKDYYKQTERIDMTKTLNKTKE